MRNGEGLDGKVRNLEAVACLNGFRGWQLHIVRQSVPGQRSDIHGNSEFVRQARQTSNVIPVLVRNQDRLDGLQFLADDAEAALSLTPAEACVDENFGALGCNEGAIAGATACQ